MKKLSPLTSAILSIVFPVGTLLILYLILSLPDVDLFPIVIALLVSISLGSALAFNLAGQALHSTGELPAHKTLVKILASAGIIGGIAEIAYLFHFIGFI